MWYSGLRYFFNDLLSNEFSRVLQKLAVHGLWSSHDVKIFHSGTRDKPCHSLVLANLSSAGREVNFFDIGSS